MSAEALDEGSTTLRVGQTFEATVEKPVYRGRGLVRVGGQVVFVPRAHAGDRVRARVKARHRGWAEATLEEVLAAASTRREPPCQYVPRCGGCAYQDLGYSAQLEAKGAILRESLARAGSPWGGDIPMHSSAEEGWRLRASFHLHSVAGGLRLGLRQEGTRRVVDIESCLQLSAGANRTLRALHARLAGSPRLHRHLRGVDLLESPDGNARVIALDTTLREDAAPGLARLTAGLEGVIGFGVRAGRLHWLHGTPYVEARVLGLSLRVHVHSFFQANRYLFEALARRVVDLLPGEGRALDLYAGVGLFALPLAARGGGEVWAVERAPSAVRDAEANVRRNRLSGVKVARKDVASALADIPAEAGERVVLDPPRTGLERGVVEQVAARRPEAVVYVSCDPPTLGRDLARFAELGLEPDRVEVFDLFPDTFHLETVVRLRHR